AGAPQVAQIALGEGFTCARTRDGAVLCWGVNEHGQTGQPVRSTTQLDFVTTPEPVPGLTGVVELVAGDNFACALLPDQTVKCWGSNAEGELGLGSHDGEVHSMPTAVPGLADVETITASSGGFHVCALSAGHSSCWGRNDKAQLGDGSPTERDAPIPVCQ